MLCRKGENGKINDERKIKIRERIRQWDGHGVGWIE